MVRSSVVALILLVASCSERDSVSSANAGAGSGPTGQGTEPSQSPQGRTASDAGRGQEAVSLGLHASHGWQIFPGGDYRYGPSIIIDTDQSIHMWTCSPGTNGAWDFIRYRHSTDGGLTWTADSVVLQPTPGTRDAYSACDPGAVHIGAYWYLGYTSTEDSRGMANQLYLARGTSPSGPFEKWNGVGWGGAPQPIATYTGDAQYYGVGEPSLVLVGKKLFVYYSYVDSVGYTDVSTVDDATADDWPAHLMVHGHVITRRPGEDSTDLKYVDAFGKFIGVSTFNRFTANGTAVLYQSNDGLAFEPAPYKGARTQRGVHNIGISGDGRGHFDVTGTNFVAYAYQPVENGWGNWPTFLDPVTLKEMPWGVSVADAVSSVVGGANPDWNWSGPRASDGDTSTLYSSVSHGATEVATETVAVDLGKNYPVITGVVINPRNSGYGFPVDFVIQTSTDGVTFTDVPGQAHVGFPNPNGAAVNLSFATPASGRYVRLVATKLGADDRGNHYLQLAELTPSVSQ